LDFVGIGVGANDTAALTAAIESTEDLSLVFIETPSNPTLTLCDIGACVAAASRRTPAPLVVVDNTFMGPVFQSPLQLGADLVVYSATKFLAGQSDMLGGAVLGRDESLIETLRGTRAVLGNILQPDEAWILDSRLPTVQLRMNRQSKNAQRVAEALAEHPKISRLHYPTLFDDPDQVRLYKKQCRHPGSIMAFELAGGKPAAFDFLRGLRIAHNAVSLGGVETLACHPATTTHSELTPEEQLQTGVSPGLVRLSIGIEDPRDLIADFRRALDLTRA
jgi:cystathionine beta-lyase/cystathionine gamma-synthase